MDQYTRCIIVLVIAFAGSPCAYCRIHRLRGDTGEVASVTKLPNCQGCSLRREELEATLTHNQITALRIEHAKQQILNKLRLKEPPNVALTFAALPKPLQQGTLLKTTSVPHRDDGDSIESDVDDFYGKTDQVILFPQENTVTEHCDEEQSAGSACVTFRFSDELNTDGDTIAGLWLYRGSNDSSPAYPEYTVSEVLPEDFNHHGGRKRIIAAHKAPVKEGWFKIDLVWPRKGWSYFDNLHTLTVNCPTCQSPVGQAGDHKPFLVVNTTQSNQKSRSKRHMNCAPGTSECCREKLYISFAEIGWDDWIIQPAGYDAYYCRGSCSSAASLTVSGSHYNTIIRKYLHERKTERSIELVPCCTATRLTSLQLLYLDDNKTITQKTLPNMVVASCGCM